MDMAEIFDLGDHKINLCQRNGNTLLIETSSGYKSAKSQQLPNEHNKYTPINDVFKYSQVFFNNPRNISVECNEFKPYEH